MDQRDYIGRRGEIIFAYLIGKRCSGRFWFHTDFLGDKAEAKDFVVYLIDPDCEEATFFAQVKATSKGYTGRGAGRKLRADVSKKDVRKLKRVTGPAYVVGIDIEKEVGFLVAITEGTGERLSGIPCKHKLDCDTIQLLFDEVERYWKSRNMLPDRSDFS